jgi:toxin FitB
MFLLDTNVISELRKPRPHPRVLAWLEAAPESDLYVSAVSLGEIQAGIEITRIQDAVKAVELDQWADLLAQSYNVLPLDSAVFRLWARLMHGKSEALYEDAMIAATAKVNGLSVVTRNTKDFVVFDLPTINPFL